jgi:hypothetical protein
LEPVDPDRHRQVLGGDGAAPAEWSVKRIDVAGCTIERPVEVAKRGRRTSCERFSVHRADVRAEQQRQTRGRDAPEERGCEPDAPGASHQPRSG